MATGDQAYILQNVDRRIVFVIPYERDFSLIGTTEEPFEGDPRAVAITDDEIEYLRAAVERYFKAPVETDKIVWSYSGVRPLYDDARADVSAVTRDYVFDIDTGTGSDRDAAPLLSVFGGKITTYRKLAEHALESLLPRLGRRAPAWTATASLPGGDMPNADFEAFVANLGTARPWLPPALARRYARAYGTRIAAVLAGARGLADLGENLGDGLYAAEVEYLRDAEWAMTADDILWRRSKLGLHVSTATKARLADWCAGGVQTAARAATRAP